jgi:hypothetical protein
MVEMQKGDIFRCPPSFQSMRSRKNLAQDLAQGSDAEADACGAFDCRSAATAGGSADAQADYATSGGVFDDRVAAEHLARADKANTCTGTGADQSASADSASGDQTDTGTSGGADCATNCGGFDFRMSVKER